MHLWKVDKNFWQGPPPHLDKIQKKSYFFREAFPNCSDTGWAWVQVQCWWEGRQIHWGVPALHLINITAETVVELELKRHVDEKAGKYN